MPFPSSIWSSLGDAGAAAINPGYTQMYLNSLRLRQQQAMQQQQLQAMLPLYQAETENYRASAGAAKSRAGMYDAQRGYWDSRKTGLDQQQSATLPQGDTTWQDLAMFANRANPAHPEQAMNAIMEAMAMMSAGLMTNKSLAADVLTKTKEPKTAKPNEMVQGPSGNWSQPAQTILKQGETAFGPGGQPTEQGRFNVPSGGVSVGGGPVAQPGQATANPKPPTDQKLGNLSADITRRAAIYVQAGGMEPEEAVRLATEQVNQEIVRTLAAIAGSRTQRVLTAPMPKDEGGTAGETNAPVQIGRFKVTKK